MQPVSKSRVLSILQGVLRHPTAPFREEKVAGHIRSFSRGRRSLTLKADRFGNLIVRYRRGRVPRGGPLLVFAAHMDHPGFISGPKERGKGTRAIFLGGVKKSFFKGTRVRFFPEGGEVPGRITSVKEVSRSEKRVTVETRAAVPEGTIGMWDLRPFKRKGERIYGRALDDLAGVGAILALLDALHRGKVTGEAAGLFTRGEEAGLNGATALALARGLPRTRSRIVTVETSKALVNARVGAGPIIRVGDRRLIFDGPITRFMDIVAADLSKKPGRFLHQRRLMDGGTCESTPFSLLGYRAGATCVALGNYHNMGPDGKIREEYIHGGDIYSLVRLFVEMVKRRGEIDRDPDPLRDEFVKIFEENRERLLGNRGGQTDFGA